LFDLEQLDSSYFEIDVQGPSAFMGILTAGGLPVPPNLEGTEHNFSF